MIARTNPSKKLIVSIPWPGSGGIGAVPILVFTFFVVVLVAQLPGAAVRWWHKSHNHAAAHHEDSAAHDSRKE